MFLKIGVFSEKQLIRMQDIKMFSEIVHALLHGIQTTNKLKLDSLYKDNDESFKFEADIENRIRNALDFILEMVDIHDTPLMKPFNLYSLILAVSHILKPVKNLSNIYSPKSKKKRKLDKSILALTSLAESLEYDEAIDDKHQDFIRANQKATSNPENRKIRFRHFCKALEV